MNRSTAAKSVGTIDYLLDELAKLAANPDTTTHQLCNRTVQVAESLLNLQWAAVVAATNDGQANSNVNASSEPQPTPQSHAQFNSPIFVAGSETAAKQLAQLNSQYPKVAGQSTQTSWLESLQRLPHVCFAPIVIHGQTWGWLIAAKETATPVKDFEREVVAGIGEIVVDHLKTKSEHHSQRQVHFQQRLSAFKLSAHASLDVQRSSKQIANDVRWLCGVERATLLSVHATNYRSKILAVSSIATIDRNSNFTKQLRSMVSLAAKNGSMVTSDEIAGQAIADQANRGKLQSLVSQWTQTSGFGFLFGIPLTDPTTNKTIGFLVLEADQKIDRSSFATALRQVQPHAAVALANAMRFESIPFRHGLSALRHVTRFSSLAKLTAIGMLIAGVVAAMLFVQMPFSVRANGELLPRIEQTVSAKVDGNIATVEVEHGQTVTAGQRLATIQSPDLIAEIESVDGEYAKTRQLIDSKKILMGQYGHAGDPALIARLAAEVSDLKFQLELLQNRQTFLYEKRQQLAVVAPRTGQIITWRPQANLLGKPVRWGDRLFDIADLDGDWEVVLQVPEQRIGYVWQEFGHDVATDENKPDNSDSPLKVEFFLQSNPNQRYQSNVIEIARSVEIDPERGVLTTIRCQVPEELKHCRHGASVVADINCGNRSLAFVCFGEFWDGLRRNWVR